MPSKPQHVQFANRRPKRCYENINSGIFSTRGRSIGRLARLQRPRQFSLSFLTILSRSRPPTCRSHQDAPSNPRNLYTPRCASEKQCSDRTLLKKCRRTSESPRSMWSNPMNGVLFSSSPRQQHTPRAIPSRQGKATTTARRRCSCWPSRDATSPSSGCCGRRRTSAWRGGCRMTSSRNPLPRTFTS